MAHFNFRLFLRPTLVGKIIIDRLTAEGADRQAEARRWIELGYMCEQAGFRLDGNTLFQAGRPAAAEATLSAQLPVHSMPNTAVVAPEAPHPVAQPASPTSNAQASAARPADRVAPSPSTPVSIAPVAEPPRAAAAAGADPLPSSQIDNEMDDNLRNLGY